MDPVFRRDDHEVRSGAGFEQIFLNLDALEHPILPGVFQEAGRSNAALTLSNGPPPPSDASRCDSLTHPPPSIATPTSSIETRTRSKATLPLSKAALPLSKASPPRSNASRPRSIGSQASSIRSRVIPAPGPDISVGRHHLSSPPPSPVFSRPHFTGSANVRTSKRFTARHS